MQQRLGQDGLHGLPPEVLREAHHAAHAAGVIEALAEHNRATLAEVPRHLRVRLLLGGYDARVEEVHAPQRQRNHAGERDDGGAPGELGGRGLIHHAVHHH